MIAFSNFRSMAVVKKSRTDEYIVIHHVLGEQDVIDFLRMTSRIVLDRLFFMAKTHGSSEFTYRSRPYRLVWTNSDLYVIEQDEEKVTPI